MSGSLNPNTCNEPAVLRQVEHRRGDGHCFAGGQQEVAGVTGSHLHEIAILAEAQDVFAEDHLYALGHDSLTVGTD